ncbi:hypothetical protein Ancab_003429 [Ancistrocladus abbreviatus]
MRLQKGRHSGAWMPMYYKFGALTVAEELFDRNCHQDYEQMGESSFGPKGLTFIAVLRAVVMPGLLRKVGTCLVRRMQDCLVTPIIKHYACMVDLLEKAEVAADLVSD